MVLEKTKNIGLRNLMEITGLQGKKLTAYDLGFVIAPRLNAAGRIAHPVDSFNLLTQKLNSHKIADKLNKLNKMRQEMLVNSVDEAIKMVEEKKLSKSNLIILKGKWDEGIVGLIASKICDLYYRPTIVLSEGDEMLKGSARSIEKINITELISNAEEYLRSFGGHAQAAGLSLKKKDFKRVCDILIGKASKFSKKDFVRKLIVDAVINYEQLSLPLAQELETLSPFGPGNPRPVLALEKVKVNAFEMIGRDQLHQKVHFSCAGKDGCFLLFNFLQKGFDFGIDSEVDIAFSVSINEFRGIKRVDLIVEDVKKSK
jgi:single-stranded-DNA-specific exonuclease